LVKQLSLVTLIGSTVADLFVMSITRAGTSRIIFLRINKRVELQEECL